MLKIKNKSRIVSIGGIQYRTDTRLSAGNNIHLQQYANEVVTEYAQLLAEGFKAFTIEKAIKNIEINCFKDRNISLEEVQC